MGFLAAVWVHAQPARPAGNSPWVLENFHGTVEIRPNLSDAWRPTQRLGQPLGARDAVRTRALSDATVVNADAGVGLDESTRVTVVGPQVLRAEEGRVFFKSLGEMRPESLTVLLPGGQALAHGTEFAIRIDSETGESSLTVLSGSVTLTNAAGGEALTVLALQEATMASNAPPVLATSRLEVGALGHVIQWMLYYPGVISLGDLGGAVTNVSELEASVSAYRLGNLPAALALYPTNRIPVTPAETVFHAALLLAGGQVDRSGEALGRLPAGLAPEASEARLALALRQVLAVVTGGSFERTGPPRFASEWLAESYWRQARGGRTRLRDALNAVTNALALDPGFGFAWVQRAELEFGFRNNARAREFIERGLALVPQDAQAHTVHGFLLAGEHRFAAAMESFEEAVRLDPGLGNAWLGRGLLRIRAGDVEGGLRDLQVAVTQEPNRSLLRSYLGKAYQVAGYPERARDELATAIQWDPGDPTPRLYSALVEAQQNRINDAVRSLEAAQALGDNRAVFRSGQLLDEDRAVQSANLASIYRDAGMLDVGVREASRAVSYDYANAAAHLFLADAYDNLRDPRGITLRYETPWQNELLLANLLSPAAAGAFSQNVSQQDYSRLFQGDYAGVYSQSAYLGNDSWSQAFSQFGIFGRSSYSVDVNYYDLEGWRPNEDTSNLSVTAKFKQQLTTRDTLFLQMVYSRVEAGDLIQYYNPTNYSPDLTYRETQLPIAMVGYHREWNPRNHTLFLALRAEDTLSASDTAWRNWVIISNTPPATNFVPTVNNPLHYESQLVLYSTEAQHILLSGDGRFTSVFGGRYQWGSFDTQSTLGTPGNQFFNSYDHDSAINRGSAYFYQTAEVVPTLQLTAGLSYDHLTYPVNHRAPPPSAEEDSLGQWSPKGGLIWTATPVTHVRFAYAASVGGASFDQSFRLEPNQVAGFIQSYRSLIPESVAGAAPAPAFDTWNVAFDHRFDTGTYVGVTGEWLESDAGVGNGGYYTPGGPVRPTTFLSELDYREKNLWFTLNQLAGDFWALGAVYRWSEATLDQQYTNVGLTDGSQSATLNQLDLSLRFNHPSGFFSRFNALWFHQDNQEPDLPGDTFWQFNWIAGKRFLERRVEIAAGILNIGDQDYQLNPLNLIPYLPRGRVYTGYVRINF